MPECSASPVFNLLDGHCHEIDGVGFAGTKGFCGGFAPYELMPFGEQGIKTFVEIAEREAIKLDYGLAQTTGTKEIAITHYAPIKETIAGEPEPIFRVSREFTPGART